MHVLGKTLKGMDWNSVLYVRIGKILNKYLVLEYPCVFLPQLSLHKANVLMDVKFKQTSIG
jgi:hypothetical protein